MMKHQKAYQEAIDMILAEAEPILRGEPAHEIVAAQQYVPSLGDLGRDLLGLIGGSHTYAFDTIVMMTLPTEFVELQVNIPFHSRQGFFTEFIVPRLGHIPHEAGYFRARVSDLALKWKTAVSPKYKGETTEFTEFLAKHDQLRRLAKKIRVNHRSGVNGSVNSRWGLQIIPTGEGQYVLVVNTAKASALFRKPDRGVLTFMDILRAVDAAVADFGYTGAPERCQIPIFSQGMLRNKQLQEVLVQSL